MTTPVIGATDESSEENVPDTFNSPYGYGAEATIDGDKKDNREGNLVYALSAGYPITRQAGLSVAYVGGRTQESTGLDSDTIAVGFSVFW